MINILCIDDDVEFLNKLIHAFDSYDGVRIYPYTTYPSILPNFDACFLDIQVHNQLSYKWAKNHIDKPIIYISNYEQYVFDVIKQEVFDFIRKSNFDEEIHPTIKRLLKHLHNKNQNLIFKYKGLDYRISLMDILYIETFSHHCFIHTIHEETYEIKKSFSSFNIDSSFLIKSHSSYIININHCLSISKQTAYLKNNIAIPISFRKHKKVIESFKNYCISS